MFFFRRWSCFSSWLLLFSVSCLFLSQVPDFNAAAAANNNNNNSNCPCANSQHCDRIIKQYDQEYFGFGGGGWHSFDWNVITTVAWPGADEQLMCHAHASGARVIAPAPGGMPLTDNKTARAQWIASAVDMVAKNHQDGITFDYESPMAIDSPQREWYVQLVNETVAAFHSQLPGSQVSVCLAWSPDDIDGRNYDVRGLGEVADLLYIMIYDTRSQIYGRCLASANSPLSVLERGLSRYLQAGVPASKLIAGIPWYGYTYPCEQGTAPDAVYCPIKEVPFRGVNCSDAAGSEISFGSIMTRLNAQNQSTPVRWDKSVQSPYFNYQDDEGVVHQVWFDNPESLAMKYQKARDMGVRGTGPYRWDQLAGASPSQQQAMWKALHWFQHDL